MFPAKGKKGYLSQCVPAHRMLREAIKKGKLVKSVKKEGKGLAKIMIKKLYEIVTNLRGGE